MLPVRELLHEVYAFRTHSQPWAIVQGNVPVENSVHDFANSLLMTLLQSSPMKRECEYCIALSGFQTKHQCQLSLSLSELCLQGGHFLSGQPILYV